MPIGAVTARTNALTQADVEALRIIRTDLVTSQGQLYDHVAATFRWIMATLFAANGSAILAMIGSGKAAVSSDVVAVRLFTAGLFFSIAVGGLSAIWGVLASIRFSSIRAKVDVCLLNMVRDDELIPALQNEKLNWKTFAPSYAAAAAFVCLVMGVLSIASHL